MSRSELHRHGQMNNFVVGLAMVERSSCTSYGTFTYQERSAANNWAPAI